MAGRRSRLQPPKQPEVIKAQAATAVKLSFAETMLAGALSRSVAQTMLQPANVVKTLLQRKSGLVFKELNFRVLTRGAGAQFLLSLPHGACNFATLEAVRGFTAAALPSSLGPILDFFSSSVATTICSIISTPQMVVTDRIMAGIYPNLVEAFRTIGSTEGLKGFYVGWGPNLAQKIPSYGCTWVFFEQFKAAHNRMYKRPPTHAENFALGAAAAGATVCIFVPLDTVKTRIVTQVAVAGVAPYKGVIDCLSRTIAEEGPGALYRALIPRLASVVPMIGIQFGVYEFLKNEFISHRQNGGGLIKKIKEAPAHHKRVAEEFIKKVSTYETQLL